MICQKTVFGNPVKGSDTEDSPLSGQEGRHSKTNVSQVAIPSVVHSILVGFVVCSPVGMHAWSPKNLTKTVITEVLNIDRLIGMEIYWPSGDRYFPANRLICIRYMYLKH